MSKTLLIVEGAMDRAAFEALLVKVGLATKTREKKNQWDPLPLNEFNILPGKNKESAIDLFNNAITNRQAARIFLAVDLDEMNRKQLFEHVEEKVPILSGNGENGSYIVRDIAACIIALGMPSLKDEWGLEKYALDDYLLYLMLEEEVFDGLKSQARNHGLTIKISHDKAIRKIKEIKELMDNQGFPVKLSEAYLEFFRAITGYIVSTATFSERLINNCPNVDLLKNTFQDVLGNFRNLT